MLDDLAGIQTYIEAAESLATFPERGRSLGRGRRELVAVLPYVVRYRLANDAVVILRIRHGKQRPEQ